MPDPLKLTDRQRELLARLPNAPSDGKLCKGSRALVANNLVAKGLARVVGVSHLGSHYYVRTAHGFAYATDHGL